MDEIEELLKALNIDRLIAIFDRDPAALVTLHANQSFYDSDVGTIARGGIPLTARPDPDVIEYQVLEILLDRHDCVVASTRIDLTSVFAVDESELQIEVMWQEPNGPLLLADILPAESPQSTWQSVCDRDDRGISP